MRLRSPWLSVLLALVSGFAAEAASLGAEDDLAAAISADYRDHLEALFEHFHRHPELSFKETKTAARLAQEIRDLGYEVTEGVGGTGVVAVLRNGDGPTVLIRADMDGLPVAEDTGLSYASTTRQVDITGEEVPVMHACGHDVHITSLVGTAKQMMSARDRWQGTLVLVGQPAEERIGGAKAMLEDGLYERFPKPDYALAFHVTSQLPSGKIVAAPGLIASSSDSVDITVHGIGSHGAYPQAGKDPIVIASQIVLALQTIVSREISPLEPAVITVGSIHGGLKHNIIPDRVDLQITVRANSEETRHQLLAAIERVAIGVGRTAGLPEELLPDVKLSVEATPTTYNDPELATRIGEVFSQYMGDRLLEPQKQEGMGAEDFAYFTRYDPSVKGLYFQVGGTPPEAFEEARRTGRPLPAHHSPFFRIEPEPSVRTGVEAMTRAALELLRKQ